MRSKTPLALMEQVIMILVFALAAALCLRVFVLAEKISQNSEDLDRAVLLCQNAAEALKAAGGSAARAQEAVMPSLGAVPSGDGWQADYDENWNPAAPDGIYRLVSRSEPAPAAGLAAVALQVFGKDGRELFSLTVFWQEVNGLG